MRKLLTTLILSLIIPISTWAFHVVKTLSVHDGKFRVVNTKIDNEIEHRKMVLEKLNTIETILRERD